MRTGARRTREKTARRAALMFAAVLLFLTAAGCERDWPEEYAGFMNDSDVLMRFEFCFQDIDRGRAGSWTIRELEALEQDLQEGYRIEDEQAMETTLLFQQAANALAEAIRTCPDAPQTSPFYEEARALYNRGWKLSIRVRSGAPPE